MVVDPTMTCTETTPDYAIYQDMTRSPVTETPLLEPHDTSFSPNMLNSPHPSICSLASPCLLPDTPATLDKISQILADAMTMPSAACSLLSPTLFEPVAEFDGNPSRLRIQDAPVCERPSPRNQELPNQQEQLFPPLPSPSKNTRGNKRQPTASKPTKRRRPSSTLQEPRRFACPICKLKFSRRYNLRTHERTHDKNRKKEFACHICGRDFDRKHDRDRHVSTVHRGERLHTCHLCDGVSFSRKDALMKHSMMCHPELR